MAPQHQPRHAADDNDEERAYNATLRARGYLPKHAKGNHDDPPTVTYYGGHGIGHTYRPDVSFGGDAA